MPQTRKKVLFLDDDPTFLEVVTSLMAAYAGESWEILAVRDTGQALAMIQEHRLDLLVVDVHMPVVDGLQFLSLVQRKYPDILKVVLTGDASEHHRAACLNNGAELFLEKPATPEGWQSVYSTLNELIRFQPEEGFRGVMRRVGLQDILQMECLARHSLVLEVSRQGTIVVQGGEIIYAEAGGRTGEEAFNYLMSLSGGEFSLKPFVEPAVRNVNGSWEFLLMEAARRSDEAREVSAEPAFETNIAAEKPLVPPAPLATSPQGESTGDRSTDAPSARIETSPQRADGPAPLRFRQDSAPMARTAQPAPKSRDGEPSDAPVAQPRADAPAEESPQPQIDEVFICSTQGDVLYQWQCRDPNQRISFLEFLSQKARQLGQGFPLGNFERLEVQGRDTRVVAQIHGDRALLVRSSSLAGGA